MHSHEWDQACVYCVQSDPGRAELYRQQTDLMNRLVSKAPTGKPDTDQMPAGDPGPCRQALIPEDVGTKRLVDSRSNLVSHHDRDRMLTRNGRTVRRLTYAERVSMTREGMVPVDGPMPVDYMPPIHILHQG